MFYEVLMEKKAERSVEGYDNEIADLRAQYKKHRRNRMIHFFTGRPLNQIHQGVKAGGIKKRMDTLIDERERMYGRYK